MQRETNRLFGFTAQQTLDYTQSLYEKKLITYPRTDSRFLTKDMSESLPALIDTVSQMLPFSVSEFPHNIFQIINNSKVSDHHAIIPTKAISGFDMNSLPAGEKSILDMLMIRLVSGVSENQIISETKVTADCENTVFTAKGKTILQDGWKAIEQAFSDSLKQKLDGEPVDTELPELAEGQNFTVAASIKEGFTAPPKHFTEDTLLSAMENASDDDAPRNLDSKGSGRGVTPLLDQATGLGTPATRAGIIEKLVKSKFIERKKKQLIATEKGTALITILPDNIKAPLLTAEWEHLLKQIELGETSSVDFITGIKKMTKELVSANPTPKEGYKLLFTTPKGKSAGACPRCGKLVQESKKGFFCEQNCGFILWKDNKFFSSKKKMLTLEVATALLKDGRIHMKKLYSEKTGKTYDATIILGSVYSRSVV